MNTAITSDRARFPVVRLYNADYNNILFVLFSDIYNYIYMTVIIIIMLFYCIYSVLYCIVIIPCSKKDIVNNHDTNIH